MTKRFTTFVFLFIFLAVAGDASAQMAFLGEVVEVRDGKTVVIKGPSGTLLVELQYISVPAAQHEMAVTVTDHLRTLALGKRVDYRSRILAEGRTIGRVSAGGVDLSQQMLRDGAAWLVPASVSGQDKSEFDRYAAMETAAKQEKRGLWAHIELSLTAEAKSQPTVAEPLQIASSSPQKLRLPARVNRGPWSDVNPFLSNVGALDNGYNAVTRKGYIGTTLLGITDVAAVKSEHKTAMDIIYHYTENGAKGRSGFFLVNVVSEGPSYRFLEKNDLVLMVDGKEVVIGKAKRKTFSDGIVMREHLAYEVSRSAVDKFANGSDVALRVKEYMIKPQPGLQMLVYNLLQASQ